MRVLLVSKFLHHVGGVETYLRWLAVSLAQAGHDVALLGMEPPSGQQIMDVPGHVWTTPVRSYAEGSPGRVRSAATSVWSPAAGRVMRAALAQFRPDVVHFHGTCYQLTSSVVTPVAGAGVPSVLTAHEYKLFCANQTLYDDAAGGICTACSAASTVTRVVAPLRRRCMKSSLMVSGLGALETTVSLPVWRKADPVILAPSPFMRDMLLRDGWRQDRVRYLDLPWRKATQVPPTVAHESDANVVFLGRLAALKGVDLILRVWGEVAPHVPNARLRILGDGEQAEALQELAWRSHLPRVDFLGWCRPDQIQRELAYAAVTVHPSQCHENSPYAVRESLMAGVPAMCSHVGGMPAMIDEVTGWDLPHDDESAWARALRSALEAPRAGSPRLLEAVMNRAVTDEAHLAAIEKTYAEARRA